MDETSVYNDADWHQPTTPNGNPNHAASADAPGQATTAFHPEEPVHEARGPLHDSGPVPYMQPSLVTTGHRADLFDRVPGPTVGMIIGALSMAAIVAIGYFALGGDDEQTATGIGSDIEAGEESGDPAGPTTGNSSAGGDQDADGGRGRFEGADDAGEDGDPAAETTVPADGSTTTEGRTSSSPGASSTSTTPSSTTPSSTSSSSTTATTQRETTTTARETTTTTRETTTTARDTTTTTRDTTTTTAATAPISIVSSHRVTFTGPTSFAFEYTTNNVCGDGSFSVTRTSDGTPIGSFGGDGLCFGPVHGGFPQASHPVFGGYVLEPNTTYTVRATVTGVATDGSRPAGSGSDTITFQVTTAAG